MMGNIQISAKGLTRRITLMCMTFLALQPVAHAGVVFGPVIGKQALGEPLSISVQVSGIPEERLSQVRSTCLQGEINPSDLQGLEVVSHQQNLWMSFSPVIHNGGLIEMSSPAPLEDPVLALRIVSKCPLVRFEHTWTLLIEPAKQSRHLSNRNMNSLAANDAGETDFSFSASALLKQSRIPPVIQSSATPKQADEQEQADVKSALKQEDKVTSPKNTEASQLPDASAGSSSATHTSLQENKPEASTSEGIKQTGSMEEATAQKAVVSNSSGASPVVPSVAVPKAAVESPSLFDQFGRILLIAGLLALVLVWFGVRYWQSYQAKKKAAEAEAEALLEARRSAFDNEQANKEPASAPVSSSDQANSTQLYQSFIGVSEEIHHEEEAFDDYEETAQLPPADIKDPVDSAIAHLKAVFPLPWTLPDSYSELISQRNLNIADSRSSESAQVRLTLTLIEYCFESAFHNQTIDAYGVSKIEDSFGELESDSEDPISKFEALPEIVLSFLNERECNLEAPEQRNCWLRNLAELGQTVSTPTLCFSSNAWSELIYQMGGEVLPEEDFS